MKYPSLNNKSKTVIGRRDRIDLPELDMYNIESKIDTGAYGCALHCHHVEIIKKNGNDILSFRVLDPNHPEYENKTFYVDEFKDKVVKSSSGQSEHRYTFKTNVTIFNQTKKVEFSLTNREHMKYPVLLGRKFLSKQFIVDVQQKDLSFQLKQKNL